jgi:Zn-dependent protease
MMDPNALKIFIYVVIVLSAVFHEYAHGFMAYRLGDPTAKNAGRLTLNPLAHMELMGTVVIPLALLFIGGMFIGWAKPVPYNPLNLRDKKYGSLKVGIAGPGANLLIAVILGIIIRLAGTGIFSAYLSGGFFWEAVGLIVYVNVFLALFNMIPMPPLDGSKVLMDLFPRAGYALARFGFLGIILALFLAFMILPYLANLIFFAIAGYSFGF